jgi:hypothetical protein
VKQGKARRKVASKRVQIRKSVSSDANPFLCDAPPKGQEAAGNGEANNAATDHDDIVNIHLNGPTEGRDVVV